MNIERLRMENKTDINSCSPIKETKHTPRYIAARIAAIGSMFLSSCGIKVSSSSQEIDSSQSTPPKVNVENIPVSNLETSIPAPVPTEQGEKVEIFSADYPATPDNFILTDTRTNEEKTKLIKSWAPDDYEKEVALYSAEIERMGQRVGDFEFESSIVDGKSWVVVPKNKKTGRMYVPKIGEMIQSSLHLWGQLDRTDDFFDLVEVGIDNPRLMGDKSGWHFIAQVENGQWVRKWYDAARDQIREVTPEPTPTPEVAYKINADFPKMGFEELARNYDSVVKEFSNVTLEEDIISGKLLKYMLSYIAENPVFTDEVENVPIRHEIAHAYISAGYPDAPKQTYDKYYVFIDSDWTYTENPNKRPVEIISYFPFRDEKLFAKLGIDPIENNSQRKPGQIAPNWPIWLAAWAYQNPSGGTTVGFSEFEVFEHAAVLDKIRKQGRDFRPVPTYKFEILKVKEETLKKDNEFIMYQIWQQYPELQPDETLIKSWIKTKEMPEELQEDLFSLNLSPQVW